MSWTVALSIGVALWFIIILRFVYKTGHEEGRGSGYDAGYSRGYEIGRGAGEGYSDQKWRTELHARGLIRCKPDIESEDWQWIEEEKDG